MHLPQLCRRMQHLIHSALTDSLFAAAVRAGIDLEHKESVYEAAKQATAPVVRVSLSGPCLLGTEYKEQYQCELSVQCMKGIEHVFT